MRQQAPFSDVRLDEWCYACGRAITQEIGTIEHVPGRVFLDRPFPENLATVHSCFRCNNGTSAQEQYVSCLIEAALFHSADPRRFQRDRIQHIVQENPAIARRLEETFGSSGSAWDDGENGRSLSLVIEKIARGQVMFDLADPRYASPSLLRWFRLDEATGERVAAFEAWTDEDVHGSLELLPEVGSRALLRLFDGREDHKLWLSVQPDRYRYSHRVDDHRLCVRFVLRGYLACEVHWSDAMAVEPI